LQKLPVNAFVCFKATTAVDAAWPLVANGVCEQQQGSISHRLVEGLFSDGLESLMLLLWLERAGLMLLLSSLWEQLPKVVIASATKLCHDMTQVWRQADSSCAQHM
jgi:hypothetical protein